MAMALFSGLLWRSRRMSFRLLETALQATVDDSFLFAKNGEGIAGLNYE
jgi:hypothetical protein